MVIDLPHDLEIMKGQDNPKESLGMELILWQESPERVEASENQVPRMVEEP